MAVCSEVRGALVVSLDASRLGFALEARGFALVPVGDRLRVSPSAHLSTDDVASIWQHRDELLRLAAYVAPGAVS